jgi:hypothetical protein
VELSSRDDRSGPVIAVLGLGQLGLGMWQALAAGSFFRVLGGFGTVNEHYVRDVSTFYVALGVGLLMAARRRAWRVPVLIVATVQYVLHTVNHLIDVGRSRPGWVGPFDAVLLGLTAAFLAALLWLEWRARPDGTADRLADMRSGSG